MIDLKPDEEERDYDELAIEYFAKYPEKLNETNKAASCYKAGKSP